MRYPRESGRDRHTCYVCRSDEKILGAQGGTISPRFGEYKIILVAQAK